MRASVVVPVLVVGLWAASAAGAPASQEPLVALLPAGTRAAAILRRNGIAPFRDVLGDDADMQRELSGYLDRTLGVDLSRLTGVALFMTEKLGDQVRFGAALRIDAPSTLPLKLPVAGDAGGTPLYQVDKGVVCARTRYGLALGDEAMVRLAVAVARGQAPSLPRDGALGRLLSADAGDVDFVLALGAEALPPLPIGGVDDGILTYRHAGVFELQLHGDPGKLEGLRAALVLGEQTALQQVQAERDKATATNDPWKGAAQIIAYYQVKRMVAQLTPKLDGKTLRVRYALPDGSSGRITFGVLGVIAGVAIDSFQKYLNRSKSSEARMQVARIGAAVVTWGQDKSHRLSSLRTTGFAPAARCCGQPGNLCAADAKSFAAPTWKALGVTIDERTRYQYRVLVDARRKQVTVEARGDLDCDGKPSVFHRTVSFGSDGPTLGPLESEDEGE